MVYPEIYDISNYDEWKKKFARKEIVTNEWDLICNEVATDIFEIPMFTSEYCDKLVENLKGEKGESINIWGHECEEMTIPDEVTTPVSYKPHWFSDKVNLHIFSYHFSPPSSLR